eukprot:jgi/Mesen1/8009/ME000425S07211
MCSSRARAYALPELRVLEVGAGDGRLCYHLKRHLAAAAVAAAAPGGAPSAAEGAGRIVVTATDNGQRGLTAGASPCHASLVRQVDAEDAIREEMPHVVVCSWMPMGVDWSECARATQSVREYILIGETEGGICGHPSRTWRFAGLELAAPGGSLVRAHSSSETESSEQEGTSTSGPGTAEEEKTSSSSDGAPMLPYASQSKPTSKSESLMETETEVGVRNGARVEAKAGTAARAGSRCGAKVVCEFGPGSGPGPGPGSEPLPGDALGRGPALQSSASAADSLEERAEGNQSEGAWSLSGENRCLEEGLGGGGGRSPAPPPQLPPVVRQVRSRSNSGDGREKDAAVSSSGEGLSSSKRKRQRERGGGQGVPSIRARWQRVELDISQWQICRTDECWSTERHSRTVAFYRLPSLPPLLSSLGAKR